MGGNAAGGAGAPRRVGDMNAAEAYARLLSLGLPVLRTSEAATVLRLSPSCAGAQKIVPGQVGEAVAPGAGMGTLRRHRPMGCAGISLGALSCVWLSLQCSVPAGSALPTSADILCGYFGKDAPLPDFGGHILPAQNRPRAFRRVRNACSSLEGESRSRRSFGCC